MKALTVRQPWAWAIIHGGKDVENRTRNIAGAYRGPVAIHAGLRHADMPEGMPREVARAVGEWRRANPDASSRDLPDDPRNSRPVWYGHLGHIIGTANLWAVHQAAPRCCPNRGAPPFGSPWAMADHWHLCLTDQRPLPKPIPSRGRLGLWTPPADTLAELRRQL